MAEQSSTETPAVHGTGRTRVAGLTVVFLWFLIGGAAHFIAKESETRIVPPYLPWPRLVVLASGSFELLGRPVCFFDHRAGPQASASSR